MREKKKLDLNVTSQADKDNESSDSLASSLSVRTGTQRAAFFEKSLGQAEAGQTDTEQISLEIRKDSRQ